MLVAALTVLVIYAAARLVRMLPASDRYGRLGEPLETWWAPVVAGAITAALVWWMAGSLSPEPIIHDEAAYLLQAGIFARGHWALPAAPYPEFFEQLHVLVTPVVAAKYPPGQALALVPGVWLGVPGLMPVLLGGLTGALVFGVARRVSGGWVGLLTWLIWVGMFPTIYRRAGYLSEDSTGAAWLIAWWALLAWRAHGRTSSLVAVAAAVGFMAITRPLTAVALAVPIAVVVIRGAWPRRAWRPLAIAAVAGTAVVSIMPVWNAEVTGDWRVSPLSLYTRAYLPFDRPGFGVHTPRATRPLPADLVDVGNVFYTWHRDFTPQALPELLAKRLFFIATDIWSGRTRVLVPFAVLALGALGAEGWFAVVSFVVLVGCYLCYAHPSVYTIYYLEAEPVLAYLSALGVVAVVERAPFARWRRGAVRLTGAAPLVVAGVAVAVSCWSIPVLREARNLKEIEAGYHQAVASVFDRIHDPKAIVFVRYGPGHNPNMSLVHNVPNPAGAPLWVVYDRGADDARLLRVAGGRVGYLFDEDAWTLTRLSRK